MVKKASLRDKTLKLKMRHTGREHSGLKFEI
jgi:hypothetical protein